MAELVKFKVVRGHLGDKITDDGVVQHFFEVGETREADPAIVGHLVPNCLTPPKGAKMEAPLEDKTEQVAENKGAGATTAPRPAAAPAKAAAK